MVQKKFNSLDLMKFLACLSVATIHIHPLKSFSDNCDFLVRVVADYAVPFFFMATGFFLFTKIRSLREQNGGRFHKAENKTIQGYVKRIFLMYVFWYIVALPATIREFREEINTPVLVLRYLYKLVITSSFRGSWFLTASVIGVLLVWLLSRVLKNPMIIVIALVLYMFCIFTSTYYGLIEHTAFATAYNAYKEVIGVPYNRWYAGVIFIAIGKCFADGYPKLRISRWYSMLGALGFLWLMIVEVTVMKTNGILHKNVSCFSLIPLSICLFSLLLQWELPDSDRFRQMRTMSSVTFYLHFQLLNLVRYICEIKQIEQIDTRIQYTIIVGACILVAMLIMKLEQYQKFKWLKYIH